MAHAPDLARISHKESAASAYLTSSQGLALHAGLDVLPSTPTSAALHEVLDLPQSTPSRDDTW